MITDGTSSITIFTYMCDLLEWDNGVTIGYNAGGDPYDNYDPSSSEVACENSPGSDWNNIVYVISEEDPLVTIGKYTMSCVTVLILNCSADDLASDPGTSTADISWTVSDIPEQLEFTVYYGANEDSLNDTSNTVTTTDDTILDYSVTLTGLRLGVTYYYQVVATYSDNTIESVVEDFTTSELGKFIWFIHVSFLCC